MKKIVYCISWAVLYAICAGLSYIEKPTALQSAAMLALSIAFFVPGLLLLLQALKDGNKKDLLLLRWICIGALALTMLLLTLNIASATWPEKVGQALYDLLIFVSVPMVCSNQWFLSLFLWACLLFGTIPQKKKQ